MTKGRELATALGVIVGVGASGVLLGLAWYALAPTLPLRKVEGGLAYTASYPEQLAAADGWFTILGFVFGVLAAVAVWVFVKRSRGPLQMVALLIGVLAAGIFAWKVGSTIGLDEFKAEKANASIGTVIQKPIDLEAGSARFCNPKSKGCKIGIKGDLLAPALGAVIMYSLFAGWSARPGLRPGEPDDNELLVQLGSGPELAEGGGDRVDLSEQGSLPGKQTQFGP